MADSADAPKGNNILDSVVELARQGSKPCSDSEQKTGSERGSEASSESESSEGDDPPIGSETGAALLPFLPWLGACALALLIALGLAVVARHRTIEVQRPDFRLVSQASSNRIEFSAKPGLPDDLPDRRSGNDKREERAQFYRISKEGFEIAGIVFGLWRFIAGLEYLVNRRFGWGCLNTCGGLSLAIWSTAALLA